MLTYEVRIYKITNMCEQNKFITAKEAFELLSEEELKTPYCVYENLSKNDNYNYGHTKEDILELRFLSMLTKINDEEEKDDEDDYEIFVGVKLKINVKKCKQKIVDYWFE